MVQCLLEFSQIILILPLIMQVTFVVSDFQFKLFSKIKIKKTKNIYILGLLMGMTNMAATIPGFVVPALVGNLTHGVVSFMSIFI